MKTLGEIRSEIDALDRELAPLLARRLRIADEVAAAKRAEGRPIDDPAREAAILDALAARVPSDCADAVRAVYRTLFAESKARQRRASPVDAVSHRMPVDAVSHRVPVDAVSHRVTKDVSSPSDAERLRVYGGTKDVSSSSDAERLRVYGDATARRVGKGGNTSSSDAERLRVYGGTKDISFSSDAERLRVYGGSM